MKTQISLAFYLIISVVFITCDSTSNITETKSKEIEPELYTIDTTVVWTKNHNPYLLKKDIEIFDGGSLTIQSGVEIYLFENVIVHDLAGDYLRFPVFDVRDGAINFHGTESDKISMLDSSGINTVGYINFKSGKIITSKSIIEGIEAERIHYWDNRQVFIYNSVLSEVGIFRNNQMEIKQNTIGSLRCGAGSVDLGYGAGIIENNKFELSVYLLSDSSLFVGNTLENLHTGLHCSHNSKTRIVDNIFKDCQVGISIFFATPTIYQNNIFNNEVNISIIPDWGNPQFDTIYATNNWWGITDSSAIFEKIKYETNGGVISGKYFEFIPFAENPFNL